MLGRGSARSYAISSEQPQQHTTCGNRLQPSAMLDEAKSLPGREKAGPDEDLAAHTPLMAQ